MFWPYHSKLLANRTPTCSDQRISHLAFTCEAVKISSKYSQKGENDPSSFPNQLCYFYPAYLVIVSAAPTKQMLYPSVWWQLVSFSHDSGLPYNKSFSMLCNQPMKPSTFNIPKNSGRYILNSRSLWRSFLPHGTPIREHDCNIYFQKYNQNHEHLTHEHRYFAL